MKPKLVDILVVGILALLVTGTHWYRLNLSPSVPLGLYRYVPRGELPRGAFVLVPAVPYGRPWHTAWIPLLKPVAGIAGDTVCVTADGMTVNEEAYGPVFTAHRGEPLPVQWGCHHVKAGHVWVGSKVPGSLDSRYMGQIAWQDTQRVEPAWIWR